MNWLLILLSAAGVLTPGWPAAGAATVETPKGSDRCLIIVETSKAMQRREDATINVVKELLLSGVGGRFPEGGTIGIWTYDEELATGQFPLQMWSESRKEAIYDRATMFLRGQKYRKKGDFRKVMPSLMRVVIDSQRLTVVLISSGDTRVLGTPNDRQIDAFFAKWRDKQEQARQPFVTIWRVRDGKFASCLVNTPPFPLLVPYLADERKPIEEPPAKVVQLPPDYQTSPVPPAVAGSQHPAVDSAPAPKAETTNVTAVAEAVPSAAVVTNAPVSTNAISATAPPPETPRTATPPPAEDKPAVATVPAPAPVTPAPPQPKTEIVKAPEPPRPSPAPVPVIPKVAEAGQTQRVAKAEEPVTNPAPLASEPPAKAAAATPPPPLPVAAAAPGGWISPWASLWMAIAVVVVGLAAVFLLLRRRRRAVPLGSLITEAIEREKGR